MTDDELVVRHVRFCDCGKRAGHIGVCRVHENDPESIRVDAATEELYARRREERFAKRRVSFDAERRESRASTDTLGLHREILERSARISTVGAGSTERGRGGGDPTGPPRQQQLDDDPRWREHWSVIRSRFERLLDLLDEAEGHGTVAATTGLLGVEKKKRVIRDGRGLSPLAVVEKLGRDITGSPRTVALDREEAGVCLRTGEEPPRSDCKCKVCRAAQVDS